MNSEIKFLVGFLQWMKVYSIPKPTTIEEAERVADNYSEFRRVRAFQRAIKSGEKPPRDFQDNKSRLVN